MFLKFKSLILSAFALLSFYSSAQLSLLKDINSTIDSSQSSGISSLVVLENQAFFVMNKYNQYLSGYELWVTDGSADGTSKFIDLNPGGSEMVTSIAVLENKLIFAGTDVHGTELWISDGTVSGTTLLKDIVPGLASSEPFSFVKVDNTLFFCAKFNGAQFELWKTDGTENGTIKVKSFNTFNYPSAMTACNHQLLLIVQNQTDFNYDFWRTDGTETGTYILSDNQGTQFYVASEQFISVGSDFYFTSNNDNGSVGLWKTDGTQLGASIVIDSNVNYDILGNGEFVYFIASDSTIGSAIWKTDGSQTSLVIDPYPNDLNFGISETKLIHDTLYFYATSGSSTFYFKYIESTASLDTITDYSVSHGFYEVNNKVFLYTGNAVDNDGNELYMLDSEIHEISRYQFRNKFKRYSISGNDRLHRVF